MNRQELEHYLAGFKGVEDGYPFGPEARVFKVAGKMFALVSQKDESPKLTLKCPPADTELLVGKYASVTPGYYMNKRHWITVSLEGDLPDGMLLNLSEQSYRLVVAKLSKREQERLQG